MVLLVVVLVYLDEAPTNVLTKKLQIFLELCNTHGLGLLLSGFTTEALAFVKLKFLSSKSHLKRFVEASLAHWSFYQETKSL